MTGLLIGNRAVAGHVRNRRCQSWQRARLDCVNHGRHSDDGGTNLAVFYAVFNLYFHRFIIILRRKRDTVKLWNGRLKKQFRFAASRCVRARVVRCGFCAVDNPPFVLTVLWLANCLSCVLVASSGC